MKLDTVQKVKAASTDKFFSPETMRHFGSTVLSKVYPVPEGALFVTGEKFTDVRAGNTRRYTVRLMNEDGTVDNVSTYLEYQTSAAAHARAAKEAANLNAKRV